MCPLVGRAPHVVMDAQAGDAVVNDVQGLVGVAVIAAAGDACPVQLGEPLGDWWVRGRLRLLIIFLSFWLLISIHFAPRPRAR